MSPYSVDPYKSAYILYVLNLSQIIINVSAQLTFNEGGNYDKQNFLKGFRAFTDE